MSQPAAQQTGFSEAHNVIIKLLTGTLQVMAFAEDVKALSQTPFLEGLISGSTVINSRCLFYIYFAMSTLNFYVWRRNGTGLVSLPLHNDLLPKKTAELISRVIN